jgi:hypothetical protein
VATTRQPRAARTARVGRAPRVPAHTLRATRGPQPPDAIVRRLQSIARETVRTGALESLRVPLLEAATEVARDARREVLRTLSPERVTREHATRSQGQLREATRAADYVQRVVGAVRRIIAEAADVPRRDAEVTATGDASDPNVVAADRAASAIKSLTQEFHAEQVEAVSRGAGLTKYVWTTQLDEIVRPGHAVLEGSIQLWSERPVTDEEHGRHAHPGEDKNCRCQAFPWDDGEESIDPVGPPAPPAPLPAPAPPVPPPLPTIEQPREELARRLPLREFTPVQPSVASALSSSLNRTNVGEINGPKLRGVEITRTHSASEFDQYLGPNGALPPRAGAWYHPGNQTIRVSQDEATVNKFFKRYDPRLANDPRMRAHNIGNFAQSREEVLEMTMTHETGHHVHMSGPPRADFIVRSEFERAGRDFVSVYATENHLEYFAEAFTGYHHLGPAWRAAHPAATRMVEAVLEIRGLK